MARDRIMKRHDFDLDACPCCGTVDIEGYSFDLNGQEARQQLICRACDATWVDVYRIECRHIYPTGEPHEDADKEYTVFIEDAE